MSNPRHSWTNDILTNIAAQYTHRNEFKKDNPNAYAAARRRGSNFINIICAHMSYVNTTWTDEMLMDAAKKFTNRMDFQKYNHKAYSSARRRGMDFLNSICVHMIDQKVDWSNEMLRDKAQLYSTRNDFYINDVNAYTVALARGRIFFDSICSHMKFQRISWTDGMLRDIALKYKTRTEFLHNDNKAYQSAQHKGGSFVDSICGHMTYIGGCDNNVVYMWRAVNHPHNRGTVVKFGITSARRGLTRITEVSRESGIPAEIIRCKRLDDGIKATDIETKLLNTGEPVSLTGFVGHTEFRALDDIELINAKNVIDGLSGYDMIIEQEFYDD